MITPTVAPILLWDKWFFSENLTNLANMSGQIRPFTRPDPELEETAVANDVQNGTWDLPSF